MKPSFKNDSIKESGKTIGFFKVDAFIPKQR
jgi:hypothetical protein